MKHKIKHTDGRFKGHRKFKYFVDFHRFDKEQNFFTIREWCWTTFGPSKEIEEILRDHSKQEFTNNSHNKEWCWHYDAYSMRIYFASDKTANWFTLKWC